MRATMRPSRLSLLAGVLALSAILVGACGGSSTALPMDGGTDAAPCQGAIYLVSAQQQFLNPGATTNLEVRWACGDQPVTGQLVSFAIEGNGGGSVLGAMSAPTDATGLASTSLTAGTTAATFQVKVSAPGATTVAFNITITTDPIGSITVNMSYGGTTVFTEYQAFLYQGQNCATMDPYTLPTALQAASPVGVISAHPQFVNLPAATNYVVAVTAKKQTELLGFGCTPSIAVTAGQTTTANVVINDIPVRYSGVYILDNRLDWTGLMPPSIAEVVKIFDELTDDKEISKASDPTWPWKYGEDPAAFLLDLVYRQFCRWECTAGNQNWDDCDEVNHELGDLEKLYTENFQSWNGAQPRYPTMCGLLEIFHGEAQSWLTTQIDSFVPGGVLGILQVIGDFSRLFDKMHIMSTLTLDDIRPGREGNFTHVLNTMLIDLHDMSGNLHSYTVDLASAGVGTLSYSGNTTVVNDKLQIPSHTFVLKFGKLVQYVYINFLLPMLGYTSTADMLHDWIDCSSVGTWLYNNLGNLGGLLTVDTYIGFCNTGLNVAGSYIDSQMDSWISNETQFTLQGECAAGELGPGRVAMTLVDGVWAGHWEEGSANANFAGTFTGTRQ